MLRRALIILWPSFLAAILAEGFFFSLFDPTDMHVAAGQAEAPAIAAYTLGFFFFWAIGALAGILACLLQKEAR